MQFSPSHAHAIVSLKISRRNTLCTLKCQTVKSVFNIYSNAKYLAKTLGDISLKRILWILWVEIVLTHILNECIVGIIIIYGYFSHAFQKGLFVNFNLCIIAF